MHRAERLGQQRVVGHSRLISSEYGYCLISTLWCLEFGSGSYICEESVGSCSLIWRYEGKSEVGRCRHRLMKGIAENWMWAKLYCWSYVAEVILLKLCCWIYVAEVMLLKLCCWSYVAEVMLLKLLLKLCCWSYVAEVMLLKLYCWSYIAEVMLLKAKWIFACCSENGDENLGSIKGREVGNQMRDLTSVEGVFCIELFSQFSFSSANCWDMLELTSEPG
jgi:hypothetical protein